MKKTVNIKGNLGLEPQVGYRAYILPVVDDVLFTSQVVDVRNRTEHGVEIETQNTIYVIQFDKENLAVAG